MAYLVVLLVGSLRLDGNRHALQLVHKALNSLHIGFLVPGSLLLYQKRFNTQTSAGSSGGIGASWSSAMLALDAVLVVLQEL